MSTVCPREISIKSERSLVKVIIYDKLDVLNDQSSVLKTMMCTAVVIHDCLHIQYYTVNSLGFPTSFRRSGWTSGENVEKPRFLLSPRVFVRPIVVLLLQIASETIGFLPAYTCANRSKSIRHRCSQEPNGGSPGR